ncbi:MAG TPA: hypothetical protein VH025_09960 [Solirubrobacteraceae bacterium]|nr:hypothetical protein [Solirubrobacteraceae bacterium]
MSPQDARRLAESRRSALRARVRRIRRAVLGTSATLLTTLFLVIYVQLASGHDPALSAGESTSTTVTHASTRSSGQAESSGSSSESSESSTGSTSGTAEESNNETTEAESSSEGSEEAESEASSEGTAETGASEESAVTTSQS